MRPGAVEGALLPEGARGWTSASTGTGLCYPPAPSSFQVTKWLLFPWREEDKTGRDGGESFELSRYLSVI